MADKMEVLSEHRLLRQMAFEAPTEDLRDVRLRSLCDSTTLQPVGLQRRRAWSSEGHHTSSPPPVLVEPRRGSKDDSDIATSPSTPKRSLLGARGPSLQMPARDISSTSTANLSKHIPASPKLDCSAAYPSPTSVLPRRSRGLDFARAATNLHHFTLAEQSSPDSSPVAGGRRGIAIPFRRNLQGYPEIYSAVESPRIAPSSSWSVPGNMERGTYASSVGSSAVFDNDSESSSSDDMMDLEDEDNTVHMATHNPLHLTNPFGATISNSTTETLIPFGPAAAKLLSYQRARLQSRRNRTRGSSSSASGHSTMQSPVPQSPPLIRTLEHNHGFNASAFQIDEPTRREIVSRRESLSIGTSDLQLSDADNSADESQGLASYQGDDTLAITTACNVEERKQVVRKAVTRRSNLLPKSKGFARIKAALLEEGAPLDTELRREAEVIRQVRDSDTDGDLTLQMSQPPTNASSPSLAPVPNSIIDSPDISSTELSTASDDSSRRRLSGTFNTQAAKHSGGIFFWNRFDERMRTPPPPQILPRAGSSTLSDGYSMDLSTPQQQLISKIASHGSACSTPQMSTNTTVFEIPRKGNNKRMRDDELDAVYFKRRAVSPGLSVQNSPVLPQSPGWWGSAPKRDDRISSNGSTSSSGGVPKRIGLQGMSDTNDGLMNMSIE